jgi:alpha-tubulin suppressor-like RCC1 family protein
LSPEGGTYLSSLSVTVSNTTGLTTRYTTNELMSTMNDHFVTSGTPITLSQTTMLQVRAFGSGSCASPIVYGLYQIGPRVVAGEQVSAFIQTNGTVWGWGENQGYNLLNITNEQYGIGYITAIPPDILASNMCALAFGDSANSGDSLTETFAVDTTNRAVWTWGGNTYPQPTNLTTSVSNVLAIASANEYDGTFTLVVKSNGTVWAWGDNTEGNLATGGSATFCTYGGSTPTPTQVMGLSGITITAIAAKGNGARTTLATSLALDSSGNVWAWGAYSNQFFDVNNSSCSEWTNTPVQVSGLTNIVAIALGADHGLALDANGFVWSWGWDSYGQLGTGDSYTNNINGRPPTQVPGLANVIGITAGDNHSVALTASGQVYTWGINIDNDNGYEYFPPVGILGTGNTVSNYVSTPQLVPGLPPIQSVGAGGDHTLAVGTYQGVYLVWGWGDNDSMQLGDGTTNSRALPVLVHLPFDTDGDGLPDWQKYELGVSETNSYANNDQLLNSINQVIGFNPANVYLNSDSYSNAFNIVVGVNPFDPSMYPDENPTNTFPVITLTEPAGAVLLY